MHRVKSVTVSQNGISGKGIVRCGHGWPPAAEVALFSDVQPFPHAFPKSSSFCGINAGRSCATTGSSAIFRLEVRVG